MAIIAEKETAILRGTFKGGVIVLDNAAILPEGTLVAVSTLPEMPAELESEFLQWDKAGEDAWKRIAEWEREAGEDPESLA